MGIGKLMKKMEEIMEAAARCAASEDSGQPTVLSSHSNSSLLRHALGIEMRLEVGEKNKEMGIRKTGEKMEEVMEAAARCAPSENPGQPPVLSSHSNNGLLRHALGGKEQ